jgi:hypothetical protein
LLNVRSDVDKRHPSRNINLKNLAIGFHK